MKTQLTAIFCRWRDEQKRTVSLTAIKISAVLDDKDAERRVSSLVKERKAAMDDSLDSAAEMSIARVREERGSFITNYLLNEFERAQLRAAYPNARRLVEKKKQVAIEEIEEPLPPDYTIPQIPPFESEFHPEWEQEARETAAAELAFENDVMKLVNILYLL